eukprot:2810534-Amphidinium_carterae.5
MCVAFTHIGVQWITRSGAFSAPARHHGPLIRIRGSSSVDIISSPDTDGSSSEEEQRAKEEIEIRSQDFINMTIFTGRDTDSFQLVDQYISDPEESDESEVQ